MLSLLSMIPILAESDPILMLNSAVALGSAGVTGYFWLIKSNKEKTSVKMYQGSAFRVSGGRTSEDKTKRVYMWLGKLFIANGSVLPNAIIDGYTELQINGQWVRGQLGWQGEGENELPWNIPPLEVRKKEIAAFFELPEQEDWDELRKEKRLKVHVFTMDGRKFTKEFTTSYTPPSSEV